MQQFRIKGYVWRDGKLVKQKRHRSVSAAIAARKNPPKRYARAGEVCR